MTRKRSSSRPTDQMNMADVAARAGVSIATVSRALRDLPGVSPHQRDRIKQIAGELSYVISPEASRLSRGATGRVAVVVPALNHWYFSTVLAGIEAVLRDRDLDVLIYHVGGAQDRTRFFEELPARRKADAVIMIALPVTRAEVDRLDLMGVQVVVAGGRIGDHPHVRIDDVAVARKAVEHLVGLGHRRVAMIRTHDVEGRLWPADLARYRGFRLGLGAAGLDAEPELVATTPFGVSGGIHAMRQLLSLPAPPTAVFAHSDEVAFGALRALQLAGVDVPGQVSVVGVDDHPLAEMLELTTVRQPVEEIGRVAARLTLDLLSGGEQVRTRHQLPVELVLRGSTAAPQGPTTSTA